MESKKEESLKQYYSVKETAEVMNVSTATIRRMIDRKELAHIKAGSRVLIPIKHFDKNINFRHKAEV